MLRRHFLGAALAAPTLLRSRAARANTPVDVELVLAVDVSRSVDPEEQELQFTGYADAFRDPRLIEGIMGGPIGAIAVQMFTWSDWNIQKIIRCMLVLRDTNMLLIHYMLPIKQCKVNQAMHILHQSGMDLLLSCLVATHRQISFLLHRSLHSIKIRS
jgi:hypothetical protein